jgi:hypothetical protein
LDVKLDVRIVDMKMFVSAPSKAMTLYNGVVRREMVSIVLFCAARPEGAATDTSALQALGEPALSGE